MPTGSQSIHGELIRAIRKNNWEFERRGAKLTDLNRLQSDMGKTANLLAQSLPAALVQRAGSRKRHDSTNHLHADAIDQMHSQHQLIAAQAVTTDLMAKMRQKMIE